MASQPQNAWQRSKQQQPASRTPPNRSNTASPSPAQQSQPSQTQHKPAHQPGNFWAQRASQSRDSSNGRPATESAAASPTTASTNNVAQFNAAEVRAFLARDAQAGYATYKVQEAPGGGKSGGGSGDGGAWGAGKTNNQSFFVQLAKQVATLEGGG